MADTKLTALSAFTPVRTDLLYGVDDPGGTPASGKMTIADALGLATATDVAIADAGSLITATDAEGALQEIASAVDANAADIADILSDYITDATQDVYVFNASGNASEARPSVSSTVVYWVNSPTRPTNMGTYDIWEGVPGTPYIEKTASFEPGDNEENAVYGMNVGSANTFTIPPNAEHAYATGTEFRVIQIGAGVTTVAGDTGVTVNGTSAGSVILEQWQQAVARKIGTDAWTVTVAAPKYKGQQHLYVPTAAMISRTTSGAEAASTELATNDVMLETMNFDTAADEHVQFSLQMPKNWDEGTLVAQFIWSHPATTTNFGVTWAIQAVAFADGDAGDTAFGTAILVDDTGGTTDDVYISPESTAITVAGTPGAEEWVVFQVYRDVSDANDTMAVDARLHGVKIHWTNNALTAD